MSFIPFTPLSGPAINAARDSLQAMYPTRKVLVGVVDDPQDLPIEQRQAGVYALVPEGNGDWTDHIGGEARNGTLRFAVLGYLEHTNPKATSADVWALECLMEAELLNWFAAPKPEPIDALYPKSIDYSRGFDRPLGWVVLGAEALAV